MTKRKTRSYNTPSNSSKGSTKEPSKAQRTKDTKDAKKFFLVLIIGTILLVSFLYFILIGRGWFMPLHIVVYQFSKVLCLKNSNPTVRNHSLRFFWLPLFSSLSTSSPILSIRILTWRKKGVLRWQNRQNGFWSRSKTLF